MRRLLNDKVNSIDVINNLAPGSAYKLEEDERAFVYFRNKAGLAQPTSAEIDAELIRLQAEYDANQYQRDRQYPSIGDQLDMQYHDQIDGTTTWKDAIAKVKSDNPKEAE